MTIQAAGVIPALSLGQRLTVAMEFAGYKPETLAPQMRCSATTIRNYLSGRTRIDYAHLTLWAKVTGVDLVWLETGHIPGPTPDGDGLRGEFNRGELVGITARKSSRLMAVAAA